MKTQMNAYEIRAKVLKMAKEQVNEEYYQKKDKWSECEENKLDLQAPVPPTIDDIMRVANEMYVFVKTKE